MVTTYVRYAPLPPYQERDQEFRMSPKDRQDVLAGRKVIVNPDWKPRK